MPELLMCTWINNHLSGINNLPMDHASKTDIFYTISFFALYIIKNYFKKLQ